MLNANEISALIQDKIKDFEVANTKSQEGQIIGVADGIVKIYGLQDAQYGEKIIFNDGSLGIVLNLEQDCIGAVALGDIDNIAEGQTVKLTQEVLTVPVGPNLLGRVVNALGEPIDDGINIKSSIYSPIEKVAPGVIWRKSIDTPLQTGLKAIDAMVPIGRGQRELIIGNRQTGKTALAIDTIINQKHQNVKCIYVAIGQKASSIAGIVRKLQEYGAMEYTTVVVATASDPVSMQYIAPYAGCAMGEYFRDRGEDALIVYDDLTKHSYAYRQISLLLRRPPGREAYPGDIFYLHSRLLERAARVNEQYVALQTDNKVIDKAGSLTALPIIETQAGDVSAFIPTNVISITDGQIFLDTDLFNAGIRPAINAGLSVSRVGGAAQTKLIKQLGQGVRLSLAQYRELASFSQFSSELDNVTLLQLERGQRTTELNRQSQYSPLPISLMAFSLLLATEGHLDDIELTKIIEFEEELHSYLTTHHHEFLQLLNINKDFNNHVANEMNNIILNFKKSKWLQE